jgi:hypothetical protein
MVKTKYYGVNASKGQNDGISFYKDKETGLINIHQGYSEVDYTVKEVKEIIAQLKQCIKE